MTKYLYYYDEKNDSKNQIKGLGYDTDSKQLWIYSFSPSNKNNYDGWYIFVDPQGILKITYYGESYEVLYNINNKFAPFGIENVKGFSVKEDDFYYSIYNNTVLVNRDGHIISCVSDSEIIEISKHGIVDNYAFYELNVRNIIFLNEKTLTLKQHAIYNCRNLKTVIFEGTTSFTSGAISNCGNLNHIICSSPVDAINLEESMWKSYNKNYKIFYTIGRVGTNNKLNESSEKENFNKLYENAINEGKISDFINKVFANCQTKEEKIKRLLKLVSTGVISLSIAFWLVGNSITQNKAESEEIMRELVEVSSKGEKVSQIERKQSNFGNFNENVVFGNDWKISDEGIAHILGTEKYKPRPYYATEHERKIGKVSIGYGHVIKNDDPKWIREAKHITEKEALEIFKMDMEYFEEKFKENVVPNFDARLQNANTMPQAVIDVMLSMAYNAGIAGFKKEDNNPFYASMKKCRYDKTTGKINKQDYDYTISKLPSSLVKQNGKVLPGLVNRRKAEYKFANV